ncbi:phosphotransferase family protein [Thermaerobacillus caldiproteolyticus]|uniref:Thiamine kinase-like enzyme n=1 Tax=Thermaerobacillus caldiproteolyticus TaxID=247480 RepID=A0A7V9Z4H4_9BACL|nr:phosphotransferase family protein [Anoxybacillus caldiproteolyticus]MBA2873856.1 thiamine kinase-like enzyme [Anoxybacillus caldiproteolyticus]QPA30408.1 phosphotransferase family protein [Anoxybacillus caldiproteolyticus]
MEQLLGKEWEITPAGGATGDAYFAQYEGRKLFLKRNSSPFLAVLSAEGIVPKLVWTKRMENGDVITAQQWLNGRELKPHDMGSEQVASLLRKIHRSQDLVAMLKRLGKTPLLPEVMVDKLKERMSRHSFDEPIVKQALVWLEQNLPSIQNEEFVVCHCDINHNNWLLSEDGRLYLIDWDGAMIADPAIDIGMLLYSYIPEDKWEGWLQLYGLELTDDLRFRMKWYVVAQTLYSLAWQKEKNVKKEMQQSLHFLEDILSFT